MTVSERRYWLRAKRTANGINSAYHAGGRTYAPLSIMLCTTGTGRKADT